MIVWIDTSLFPEPHPIALGNDIEKLANPLQYRGCLFVGVQPRGDCEHFVGMPLELNKETTDEYGRPHGWCEVCWRGHQIADLKRLMAPVGVSTDRCFTNETEVIEIDDDGRVAKNAVRLVSKQLRDHLVAAGLATDRFPVVCTEGNGSSLYDEQLRQIEEQLYPVIIRDCVATNGVKKREDQEKEFEEKYPGLYQATNNIFYVDTDRKPLTDDETKNLKIGLKGD